MQSDRKHGSSSKKSTKQPIPTINVIPDDIQDVQEVTLTVKDSHGRSHTFTTMTGSLPDYKANIDLESGEEEKKPRSWVDFSTMNSLFSRVKRAITPVGTPSAISESPLESVIIEQDSDEDGQEPAEKDDEDDNKLADTIANAINNNASFDLSNKKTEKTSDDEDDDLEAGLRQPLLGAHTVDPVAAIVQLGVNPPPKGWLDWAQETRFRRLVVKPFIAAGAHIKDHYIADAIALLGAIPGGINAFCMFTAIDPKYLAEGIAKMTGGEMALSIFNAFCSISVNTVMNAWFLVGLKDDLTKSFNMFKDSIDGKIAVPLAIIIGLSAFVAAGAIGYSASLWLPAGEISALLPGALNASMTFVSRFNGLIRIIQRITSGIKDFFNNDKRLQRDAIHMLRHLSDKTQTELNDFLKDKNINEDTIDALFNKLDEITFRMNASDDENSPFVGCNSASWSDFADYMKLAFKVLFASTITYFIFPTFDQKGFDGLNVLVSKLSKLGGNEVTLDHLSNGQKIGAGALPGSASAFFFWFHMFDLPDVVSKAFAHLKDHHEDIFHAMAVLVASVFSGSSMYNIAGNIAKKPDNLFGDSVTSLFSQIKMWANGVGGTLVNEKVIANKMYPDPAYSIPAQGTDVNKITAFLQHTPLSHDAVDGLKSNSIFFKYQSKPEEPGVIHDFSPGIL